MSDNILVIKATKRYFFFSCMCVFGTERHVPKHICVESTVFPSQHTIKRLLEVEMGTFEELVVMNYKEMTKQDHDEFIARV
jgi:hypothetical protein